MRRDARHDHDDDHHTQPQSAARTRDHDDDGDGPDRVAKRHPGGKDPLGQKENVLSRWYDEMAEVAHELAGKFTPLGLHFRPQILLATAMQEASASDPLTTKSFDNGLGIMQITPYNGKLDPQVARSIGWDNSKSVAYNNQHSKWRDAKSNLEAGAYTMLSKASSIKAGVPQIWSKMDEAHRWRAVLFAYNAGQGSAISALKRGGPNASMISTYTVNGRRVSHDYTKEIKAKMDYVDRHDPFEESDGEAEVEAPKHDKRDDDHDDKHREKHDAHPLTGSVGRGGTNRPADVRRVQRRLEQRGIDPGPIDGLVGPLTIGAIESFQAHFLSDPDGLIERGKTSEEHLFRQAHHVTRKKKPKPKQDDDVVVGGGEDVGGGGGGGDREHDEKPRDRDKDDHPTFKEIAKNFHQQIPGSNLTWHQALYLPSWGRHVRPGDVTNTSMSTVLHNIERQAAALTKLASHFHKKIVVHCWLRPPAYNAHIGGAGNSAHLRGTATDFHFEGLSAEYVRDKIRGKEHLYAGAGENGVPWLHLDLEHQTWFWP